MRYDRDSAPSGQRPSSAWQFGIGSLLVFFAASALVLGLSRRAGIGYGVAWFAIGFFALAAVIANLMHASRGSIVAIYESDSPTDAMLCCQQLREQGIAAVIRDGELSALVGVRVAPRKSWSRPTRSNGSGCCSASHRRNAPRPARARRQSRQNPTRPSRE
jgi:hypothetical protein